MRAAVSVMMTVRGEPADRLERVLGRLAAQEGCGPLEMVVAAPPGEMGDLWRLASSGAIGALHVVPNPTGRRSAGLNAALQAAAGEVICRIDARSLPPPDYVARCLKRLSDPRVGVVGGVQVPSPGSEHSVARGISRALAHPWLLGGAAYRRTAASGPVDTVYLGAFRRSEALALGGYDHRLDANEDFDLCQRYRDAGFDVWLEGGLLVGYEARSRLPELWSQYHAFGRSKTLFWRVTGRRANRRQQVALGAGLVGATAVLAWARRPRRLVAAGASALLTVAALDHVCAPRAGSIGVRLSAYGGYLTVITAWLAGAVAEAVVGGRSTGRSP